MVDRIDRQDKPRLLLPNLLNSVAKQLLDRMKGGGATSTSYGGGQRNLLGTDGDTVL